MKVCEFADEVSKKTGVPKEICSQIWVQTLNVLKKDFQAVDPPEGFNPKELYDYFCKKRLGLRFGPLRLCMNIYDIMRKVRTFHTSKRKQL